MPEEATPFRMPKKDAQAMTPDELREVGEALYGPLWREHVSKDLKVNSRTVQRWDQGEGSPSGNIRAELAVICRQRAEHLLTLAAKLDAQE